MKRKAAFLLSSCIITLHIVANNTSTLHSYFWANYKHFLGDIDDAHRWYKKLFSTQHPVYSYKGYLSLLCDTQQWKKIIQLMPSLENKFDQDPDVQLIFIVALEKTNQQQKADSLTIKLSQTFKTHQEIALKAAQTYVQRNESENALLTISAFLNNAPTRPHNFIFYFLQSQIQIQLNQLPQALESITQCLDMHPHFDKGWLVYATLNEKNGKIKEALAGYSTFLELSGGNRVIEQHLLSLMSKYQTAEQTQQNLVPHTVNLNNVLILLQRKQYTQALAHIDHCIALDPKNDEYKLMKIQILTSMKKGDQAASTLVQWIMQEPDRDIWPKCLYLLSYSGINTAQIIASFNTILTQNPHHVMCNLYCADLHMRLMLHHNHAIAHLENAAATCTDTHLKHKIFYQLALLHYEQTDHHTMHTYLEQAYALKADCPHTTNALAYYWATKGKDLAKAHHFIEKSLNCDKNNPYFLDTQALILYKEKKYEQAQQILEQLTAHHNSTMLLHLAKIHYSLNNKEAADSFTKKAEALVKNNREKRSLEKMQLRLSHT